MQEHSTEVETVVATMVIGAYVRDAGSLAKAVAGEPKEVDR